MKHFLKTAVLLVAGAVVAGCASTPRTSELNQAQTFYGNAENDPLVAQYAPVPLDEARQDLERAANAETEAEQRHYAYMAEKKVELARTDAQREAVRNQAENLRRQQEQFVLELRAQQARQAKQEASEAREQLRTYRSLEEQRKLETARQEAQQAQEELETLRREMSQLQAKAVDAQRTDRGMVLTLSDVVFAYNEANLKTGALRGINRLAEFLKEHPDRRVLIEGFTDSRGSELYNRRLSERRADSVAEALRANGISPDRIVARGLGENFPIATNETNAGRQRNRRVEITIMNPEQGGGVSGEGQG